MTNTPPRLSVVIPVHNEEPILRAALTELRERLQELGQSFELILCENGSRDQTLALAEALAARYSELRVLHVDEPNYGKALRRGIEAARGEVVVCDEIDLCDVDFYARALAELERSDVDMVVGSKLAPGSRDERPLLRHAASHVYSLLLRYLLGFRGTDTHGLKAFRRTRLLPVVERCVIEKDVFSSELVIRAQRMGRRIEEIPVRVLEKRTPSINLVKRIPRVVSSLARLRGALREPPGDSG